MGLLLDVIKEAEFQIQNPTDMVKGHQLMPFVIYATISYVMYLRGSKWFLLALKVLHTNWLKNDGLYFIADFFGEVKGESVDRTYIISCQM